MRTKKEIKEDLESIQKGLDTIEKLKSQLEEAKEKLMKELSELFVDKNSRNEVGQKINSLFEKYAEIKDNVILIAETGLEYGRQCCFGRSYGLGEGAYPERKISTRLGFNSWCDSILVKSDKFRMIDLFNDINELIAEVDIIDSSIIPYIEDVFNSSHGINEMWSGYLGITRDYKLVSFVCRYDGFMLNQYKKFPNILFDFKEWKRA